MAAGLRRVDDGGVEIAAGEPQVDGVPVGDGIGAGIFGAREIEGDDQPARQSEQGYRQKAPRLTQVDDQWCIGEGGQFLLR